jgi:microcystin-dependent protein
MEEFTWITTQGSTYSKTMGSAGGGEAHNNMPLYYALAYILRIA